MLDTHKLIEQSTPEANPQDLHKTYACSVSAMEAYSLVRQQIEHEDELVNQRVNWLLFSQAFFFGTFATILTTGTVPIDQSLMIDLIATTGIVLCICAFSSILAAMESHGRLTKFWRDSEDRIGFPQISGVTKQANISLLKSNGSIFAGGIPLLITLLWLLVLLFVSFSYIAIFVTPVAVISLCVMIKSLLRTTEYY
jgi:hypothetical protein